jgi:template-activating factor I
MSTKAGKKRASPGADVEKNPLQGVELSEGDAHKLEAIQREQVRVELAIGKHTGACHI